MLLKAGQIVQSMAPLLAQSLTGARFSKASFSTAQPKVDRKLLYPFNTDKTRLAVDSIQEYTNSLYEKDLKGLVVLDKLSQTITSDTHRVFDKCENKFFAVKTLNLDSDSSWKQLNLILRQQEENYSNLQKFSFLNYDHAGKEAKIITEIQKNVLLKDVLTPRTWETEELKNLTLQLLRQADSLKQLGAYCNYVKPEHIFADQVTQTLKLFDFSGFEIEPNNMSWGHHQPALNIDAIVFSLVKIIDPFAAVNHPEEAQIYMSRRYPEFYQELNKIKSKAEYLSSWFNMRSFEGSFHEYNQTAKNSTVFHSPEYDQLNLNKFKQLIMSEQLPNFNEVWGSVNQGFGKYGDAVSAFEKSLEGNIARYGYIHESTCRSYLDLAETYKAMEKPSEALDYFKKAVNISYNMPNMDGLLTARLYNGFGDLLREQKQYIDALDCFEKAEKALKNSGVSHPSFAAKIEANLNLARKNAEPSGNVYEDFKNAWKNSSNDHHHNWQNWHNMTRDERFAAKMNWFGERIGRFGKNMEDIGERYKNFTWDHTNNTWHYKQDKHSQERWERKMERFASKMNGFGERMERFGKKMENMGDKWKNQDWEAMHSKWNSKDFFRQKHYDWWQKRMNPENTDKTEKAEKAQEASNHHHSRSFMNCYGRGYGWHHHHHHHKGHWGWSHHSFGSWNKPPGCGFFYRTRRFFRVMFKIMFYSFCFVLFCKLWRKAMKGPSDRPCDPSYQMNGPSVGPIQNDEKKDRWSSWHREWHGKHDQQNGQMNQINGNDDRKSWWWHRHHHCKKNDQQNDQVNQMNNNEEKKKGWWASWHDEYHRKYDQQNDQVNGNDQKNEKKGWWWHRHHCKKNKEQQNEPEVSGQEPERRRRHSAAPVMTQEQGVQTEEQNQDMRHQRRGFEQFRRRYGENFDQKEYEDAMKKFEEFSARREQMRQARHSRARSEENVPNVAQVTEVVRENPEQNRTTFVQQPPIVNEVKKQDFVEKKVELRQNAPLPVRKTEENIKVSHVASEMNKDLPAPERSNSWLAFGFFALVSTLGLSL